MDYVSVASAHTSKLKPKRPKLVINAQCTNYKPVQKVEAFDLKESDFATEILPWLWLGSAKDAFNYDTLKRKNIKYILNATKEVDSPEAEAKGFQYLKLHLEDNSDVPIGEHFDSTHEFIERARKHEQGVLVHCRRGISRSATIVIAYVMKFREVTFENAFEFVKQRRDIINPNLGFVLALESLSSESSSDDEEQCCNERRRQGVLMIAC
eukprot:NODE_524_length_1574_cov_262.028852_g399_i0.p2 GENE.NODE_524_length_1574_cov_262.028852_g399_i0~~NODE_524_length_1574_cov_262.028852_g399_i0.p2  ORF type:complete len:210 (-),score=26.21 NODE_524_length_1574_cov_262.028852_g399_i0:849-1478(-)